MLWDIVHDRPADVFCPPEDTVVIADDSPRAVAWQARHEMDRAIIVITDLEKERNDARRALRSIMDRLTDALHAHDAGRTAVVQEFIERSIDEASKALAS